MVIGDSDFAANFALGIQGNRDLFLNIVNWAGAAGEPDLDPAEGSRRPTAHADRVAAEWRDAGSRCSVVPALIWGAGDLQLVAEARMKGLRTLGVLVVAARRPGRRTSTTSTRRSPSSETEEKPKVFAVEADQIEELKVSTIAGGVAELKKAADGW